MGTWRRVILANLLVGLTLALPSAAMANGAVKIGTNGTGEPTEPAVAVDASGTAYIAWQSSTTQGQMNFCKVALGATGCNPVALDATGTMSGPATLFDPPSVILSGSDVYVYENVDGSTDAKDGIDEWLSTNGGGTFTLQSSAVSYVPGGPDENPVIRLPGDDIGIAYNAVSSDPLFQVNTLNSPTAYSAASSTKPPFATINAPSNAYTLTNQAAQFGSQLTGTPGVLGVAEAFPGPGSSPCPSSSPDSLVFAYAGISTSATGAQILSELDKNPGSGSAWGTLGTVDCDGENPAVGGGPSGFGLLETNAGTNQVQYRRFTPPAKVGAAVTIGPGDSTDDSLSQDSSGGIYATWLDGDTGVTLAYSANGGASWDGPVSLLGNDDGELGIGSLASSVNATGVGWAAYEAGGNEYAQPFDSRQTTPAPTNTSPPGLGGTAKAGETLTCSTGAWTGNPSFTYQWYRNGTLLAGVTGPTYKVATIDEGSTFQCVVIATNTAGSASAKSKTEKVPVPYVKRCPAATGKMTGTQVGLLKLNMTRKQARYVYRRHSSRGFKYKDFFCLTPEGVRAGYATPKLLKTLSKRRRKAVSGRVVWASTSDPFYELDGVRAGESILTAAKQLHTGKPLHIGKNDWYLARKSGYTAVLKVRGIVVQELGIADNSLTKTRADESVLMHSFY